MLKIAIVGRPNVGKSTLFNCLIKKNKAIVSPISGVTRDASYAIFEHKNLKARIIDMGGITTGKNLIDELVVKKAFEELIKSDIILLVFDAHHINDEDYEIVNYLRKITKPMIVIGNKIDTPGKEYLISDIYELGFKDVIPIAAVHKSNITLLIDKIYELSKTIDKNIKNFTSEDDDTIIPISIIGKPNTGKSSLLNYLVKKERSIVTDIPGTTRDNIEANINFEGTTIKIVDTAGIRRKKNVSEDIEFYSVRRSIRAIEDSNISILLIDAGEGLANQDKKIAQIVNTKNKALIIAVNKWDTMPKGKKVWPDYEQGLKFFFPIAQNTIILPISAKSGFNIHKLIKNIIKLNKNYNIQLSTHELTNSFQTYINKRQIARSGAGNLKILYAVQVKSAPVVIRLYTNSKSNINKNYKKYLLNSLIDQYNLSGIPVILKFFDNNKNQIHNA